MDLLQLPDEIFLVILHHASEKEWCALAQVSRALYRLASDGVLWSRRIHKYHQQPTSPTPRVCHTSWIYKNNFYVYGGHQPLPGSNFISDVKNDLFAFDLQKSQWKGIQSSASFPTRTEHTAALINDKVYIAGGYSGVGGYKMEVFSFELNAGEELNHLASEPFDCRGEIPQARSAHSCVYWKDSLYIFGGWNGAITNDDFYKLNLKKLKWKRVRDHGVRPSERRSHCAVVVGDSMYLFGGYTGEQNCFPHLHRFDFVTKKWSIEELRGLRVPPGRSRARIISFGNCVAVSGGWDRVNHFQDWWEFNLTSKEWRSFPVNFPSPYGQHTMEISMNKAYIFGGYHTLTQSASDSLWSYSLGHIGRLSNEA